MFVSEVTRMEDKAYKIRAMSQQQQDRWTNWEAFTNRVITWADMRKLPHYRVEVRWLQHVQKQDGRQPPTLWKSAAGRRRETSLHELVENVLYWLIHLK